MKEEVEEEEKDQYRPYSSDYFINKEIEFYLSFELNEDEDNSIGFKYGKEKEAKTRIRRMVNDLLGEESTESQAVLAKQTKG